MKLSSCKKLNWPKYQQEKVTNEKKLSLKKMITEKYIKSYFLFKQKFVPEFSYLSEYFNPMRYIKKDIPDDVIEVIQDENKRYKSLKEIKLYKSVLEKMQINAASEILIKTNSFYEIENFNFNTNIEAILRYPEGANEIYFVLDNLYMPKEDDLFYNLENAKQEISLLSKNEFEYKLHVFLLSFSLFFLERLHSYFLDLLKDKQSVKIQMYKPAYVMIKSFFEIVYSPIKISRKDFVYNTIIISDKGSEIISMDEKIEQTIKQYLSYINEITNKEFDLSSTSDVWFVLYNVAFNAFVVYTLVYLYHILDLDKIFDDFNYPKVQTIAIKAETGLVVKNHPIFGIEEEFKIYKNSLLENIIMEKVREAVTTASSYLFFTADNKFTILDTDIGYYTPAIIDFLQRSRIKKKAPSAFLVFEELDYGDKYAYRVIIPTSIESFLLFYQTLYSNEDKPIDVIYKLAHEALYKESKKK